MTALRTFLRRRRAFRAAYRRDAAIRRAAVAAVRARGAA